MEEIKNYILSLTGISFISSLVCTLLPDIPTKKTVKFICGIILAVTILSPLPGYEPDFTGIFSETESYKYNDNKQMEGLNRKVILDKVSETIDKVFGKYGNENIMTEVVFGANGEILAVNINTYNEVAARETAALLGLPVEMIRMTE